MNRKGFAISVILYVIVFLIIAVFYILLGIVKSRYSVNNDLKNNISNTLNGIEYIYGKLDNENAVNVLKITINGGETEDTMEFIKYGNDTLEISNPTRDPSRSIGTTYTLSYNSNGGIPIPANQTASVINVVSYLFNSWDPMGDCGELSNGTYTFPERYGTICTLTAAWSPQYDTEENLNVTVANGITKAYSIFDGWKSSIDGKLYQGGDSYFLNTDTVMTAQWTLDVDAVNLEYNNSDIPSCTTVQCALDEITNLVNHRRNSA